MSKAKFEGKFNPIKEAILKIFQEKACELFLQQNKTALLEEIEQKVQEAVKDMAKSRSIRFPEKNQALEEVVGSDGTTYKWDKKEYNSFKKQKETSIQNEITYKYTQTFVNDHWNKGLKDRFDSYFNALKIDELFYEFAGKHPWFIEEPVNTLETYSLIFIYLYNKVIAKVNPDSFTKWNNILDFQSESNLPKSYLVAELRDEISGYPLSDISKLYIQRETYFPSLKMTLEQGKSGQMDEHQYTNHLITRVDLFCHLFNQYNEQAKSTLVNNVNITSIAPFDAKEVNELPPAHLLHLQTMLVDIGEPSKPIWVCLHKNPYNESWTAFIPKQIDQVDIGAKFNKELPTFLKNNNVSINTVNYEGNVKQNELGIKELPAWNAVLLGRVLPFCSQTKQTDIKEYRNNVSVDIFIEYINTTSLPGNKAYAPMVQNAFSRRAPFSNEFLEKLLNLENKAKGLTLESDVKERAMRTLQSFDQEELVINSQLDTLTLNVNEQCDQKTLVNAETLLFFNKNLTRFVMPAIERGEINEADHLFEYNTSLLFVSPISDLTTNFAKDSYLDFAMRCAARNRFLKSVLNAEELEKIKGFEGRSTIWTTTGYQMVQFCNSELGTLDLDAIKQYQMLKDKWAAGHFDLSQPITAEERKYWLLAQTAQMGTLGTTHLFNYLEDNYLKSWDPKTGGLAPDLNAVFDVAGNLSESGKFQLDHLNARLKQLNENKSTCRPLFKSFSLVLPRELDTIQDSLIETFTQLNQSKIKLSDTVEEITLYNFPLSDKKQCNEFLTKIEKLANSSSEPLQVLLHLPEWDLAEITDNNRDILNKYKEIQNKILNNQRLKKFPQLQQDVELIHNLSNVKLEIVIKSQRPAQFWGEDKLYPLTLQMPGVQQQLQQGKQQQFNFDKQKQQEQQQQQQQQKQQQQQQEQALRQESGALPYKGSVENLITRENIDEKCKELWEQIPEETKKLSGLTSKSLAQLFSLWVGSDKNASFVISKIDINAVKKIMEHANFCRFGMFQNDLPPGFSLAKAGENLILCFDEKQEQKDLHLLANERAKSQNPFVVKMEQHLPALSFNGDYRQFSILSKDVAIQKLLWNFLATKDKYSKSVQDQELVNTGANTPAPGDFTECRKFLINWAIQKGHKAELVQAILGDANEANLRAFGQLFYKHEVDKSGTKHNASDEFFILAKQIMEQCEPEFFNVWNKYCVKTAKNHSECLKKDEVSAISLSIATLKANPKLSAVWRELVKAQGEATGFIQYAALWYSFQKLMDYAEKNEIQLNEEAIIRYLEAAGNNFNAQVFLGRLHAVLTKCEKVLDKKEAQKNILDNVDKIDWNHNGYFYAANYENFPRWDKAQQLSAFNASVNLNKPSYIPALDGYENITAADYIIQIRRYLTNKMRASSQDYTRLNELIEQTGVVDNKKGILSLRILIGCLTVGNDKISGLNEENLKTQFHFLQSVEEQLLSWLNRNFKLDGDSQARSLDINFACIPTILQVIQQSGMTDKVLKMEGDDAKEFIANCTRAYKCFSNPNVTLAPGDTPESALSQLIKNPKDNKFTTFPWLYNNKIEIPSDNDDNLKQRAIKSLIKRLKTIDPVTSRSFPGQKDIEEVCQNILTTEEGQDHYFPLSKKFVPEQTKKGSDFISTSSIFRALTNKEKEDALVYLSNCLLPQFKSQNLQLAKQLLDHMVVGTTGDQQKQITDLLEQFTLIDNKPHFNEAGLVLGLLLEKAKKDGAHRNYSIGHLTEWLNCLMGDSEEYTVYTHFPTNILDIIVQVQPNADFNNPSNESLLSNDPEKLRLAVPLQDSKRTIMNILYMKNINNRDKASMAQFAISYYGDFSAVQGVINLLENLSKKSKEQKINAAWIQNTLSLVEKLPDLRKANQNYPYADMLKRIEIRADEDLQFNDRKFLEDKKKREELIGIWADCQATLIELYSDPKITPASLDPFTLDTSEHDPQKNALIQIILIKALAHSDLSLLKIRDRKKLTELKTKLANLDTNNLIKLATYCGTDPVPSVKEWTQMLDTNTDYEDKDYAKNLIHHYETVIQTTREDNTSKRQYNITPEDHANLVRVIAGIKEKGRGKGPIADWQQKELINLLDYIDNFSQLTDLAHKDLEDLQSDLIKHRDEISKANIPYEKHQASARLLACMREILLRKTGKWINHTQMLDLVYAAINNDVSLLHQVRTGEGKSILSMEQVAFLALNGYVVDLFSSKESLSIRDYNEFRHVLQAMNIPVSYITPGSGQDEYKNSLNPDKIGGVNFSTQGNLSLYHLRHIWDSGKDLRVDPEKVPYVSFLDEADEVLSEDNTQFNYSAQTGNSSFYNLDAWVYELAYKFYLQNKDSLIVEKDGTINLSSNRHLKALCELIERESALAPEKSTFMQTFIDPALDKSQEHIDKRNNELSKLLVAAHIADHMTNGIEYAICPDNELVNDTYLNTRFASVLIKNQIQPGSTYSDYIQHLVHVINNERAVARGEQPNFFVKPNSEITLSSNAAHVLKRVKIKGGKITGLSGTTGDVNKTGMYKREYGISTVIKLSTHRASNTTFLGAEYVDTETQQYDKIIAHLCRENDRPILLYCANDKEVKEIYNGVINRLKERNIKDIKLDQFIVDTNDSGKSENEILARAGKMGSITLSSRMGRGTDIKPESRSLIVIPHEPWEDEEMKNEELDEIISQLQEQTKRPVLLNCNTEAEVKNLYEAILQRIKDQNIQGVNTDRFLIDTQDNNLTKDQLIERGKAPGTIIISAKENLKKEFKVKEKGLFVIPLTLLTPEEYKQVIGRQGRQGMEGVVADVILFPKIKAEYDSYVNSTDPLIQKDIDRIMKVQKSHMNNKINKPTNQQKYAWLRNDVAKQESYVIARSVIQLRTELKRKQEKNQKNKNDLIALLSENFGVVLCSKAYFHKQDQFKEDWCSTKKKIENLWNKRLQGRTADNDDVYNEFINGASAIWLEFYSKYGRVNKELIKEHIKEHIESMKARVQKPHEEESKQPVADTVREDVVKLKDLLQFYQNWTNNMMTHYYPIISGNEAVKSELFPTGEGELNILYKCIYDASSPISNTPVNPIFDFIKNIKESKLYGIKTMNLVQMFLTLPTLSQEDYAYYTQLLTVFFEGEAFNNIDFSDAVALNKRGDLFDALFALAKSQKLTPERVRHLESIVKHAANTNKVNPASIGTLFTVIPDKLLDDDIIQKIIKLLDKENPNETGVKHIAELLSQQQDILVKDSLVGFINDVINKAELDIQPQVKESAQVNKQEESSPLQSVIPPGEQAHPTIQPAQLDEGREKKAPATIATPKKIISSKDEKIKIFNELVDEYDNLDAKIKENIEKAWLGNKITDREELRLCIQLGLEVNEAISSLITAHKDVFAYLLYMTEIKSNDIKELFELIAQVQEFYENYDKTGKLVLGYLGNALKQASKIQIEKIKIYLKWTKSGEALKDDVRQDLWLNWQSNVIKNEEALHQEIDKITNKKTTDEKSIPKAVGLANPITLQQVIQDHPTAQPGSSTPSQAKEQNIKKPDEPEFLQGMKIDFLLKKSIIQAYKENKLNSESSVKACFEFIKKAESAQWLDSKFLNFIFNQWITPELQESKTLLAPIELIEKFTNVANQDNFKTGTFDAKKKVTFGSDAAVLQVLLNSLSTSSESNTKLPLERYAQFISLVDGKLNSNKQLQRILLQGWLENKVNDADQLQKLVDIAQTKLNNKELTISLLGLLVNKKIDDNQIGELITYCNFAVELTEFKKQSYFNGLINEEFKREPLDMECLRIVVYLFSKIKVIEQENIWVSILTEWVAEKDPTNQNLLDSILSKYITPISTATKENQLTPQKPTTLEEAGSKKQEVVQPQAEVQAQLKAEEDKHKEQPGTLEPSNLTLQYDEEFIKSVINELPDATNMNHIVDKLHELWKKDKNSAKEKLKTIKSVFDSTLSPDREEFKSILKLFHEGYLTDKQKYNSWIERYRNKIQEETEPEIELNFNDHGTMQTKMTDKYKKIVAYAKDISEIHRVGDFKLEEVNKKPTFKGIFAEQKRAYEALGWWSTSSTRKEQASELFDKLDKLKPSSDYDYYTLALSQIRKTQSDILRTDKKAFLNKNKKGYSRLYDITVEMTVRITSEALASEALTMKQKAKLIDGMQENLQEQVLTLFNRLPRKLRDELTVFADPNQVVRELIGMKNKIPTHLHYLVTNLEYLSGIDLPESTFKSNK